MSENSALNGVDGITGPVLIGRGPRATVYRAMRQSTQQPVAVRVLNDAVPDERRTAFEARRAAVVRTSAHPAFVDIMNVGWVDDGRPYLVTELATGSLGGDQAAGPTGADAVIAAVALTAEGLVAAHAAGVVHGHVTPGNLMRCTAGIRLADFGLATEPYASRPEFAPPETVWGVPPAERGDVYGLCVTAYALLLGHPPRRLGSRFPGVVRLRELFDQSLPGLPALPTDLIRVLQQGIAYEPEARPSMTAVRDALAGHLASLRTPATSNPFHSAAGGVLVAAADWQPATSAGVVVPRPGPRHREKEGSAGGTGGALASYGASAGKPGYAVPPDESPANRRANEDPAHVRAAGAPAHARAGGGPAHARKDGGSARTSVEALGGGESGGGESGGGSGRRRYVLVAAGVSAVLIVTVGGFTLFREDANGDRRASTVAEGPAVTSAAVTRSPSELPSVVAPSVTPSSSAAQVLPSAAGRASTGATVSTAATAPSVRKTGSPSPKATPSATSPAAKPAPTSTNAKPPAGVLKAETSLGPNATVKSPNGRYSLIMQRDGNLVLLDGSKAVWAAGTDGTGVDQARMQSDGNFVLYAGETPKWDTDTDGTSGAYLAVQDDGNLVLYSGDTWKWDRFAGKATA